MKNDQENNKSLVGLKSSSLDVTAAIIEMSTRADIDPERIEKLMNLQVAMENRQAEQAFNRAMAAFQCDCPIITKTKKVKNKDGTTRYAHAVIDEMIHIIKPIMGKHGLSYSFDTRPSEKDSTKSELLTTIGHVDGFSKTSVYTYESLDDGGQMNSSQRRKSALSYAKRAGLENALGLVTAGEDDDANRAVEKHVTDQELVVIRDIMKNTNTDEGRFLKFLKVTKLEDLSSLEAKKAINALKQKRVANV